MHLTPNRLDHNWSILPPSAPDASSEEQEQFFREHLRLQATFPGEYVVYHETQGGDGIHFKLLLHSESIDEIQETLRQHPDAKVAYLDDPSNPEQLLLDDAEAG